MESLGDKACSNNESSCASHGLARPPGSAVSVHGAHIWTQSG